MDLNWDRLIQQMEEAQLWCSLYSIGALEGHAHESHQLEGQVTEGLQLEGPARQGLRSCFWDASNEERAELVRGVVGLRRKLLQADAPPGTRFKGQGRLLLFFPDGSLSDGAAQVSSEGFFDVDNVPPPDTWVEFGTDGFELPKRGDETVFLLCWVPLLQLERVAEGIRANPETCIEWASEFNRPLTRGLRERGFLESLPLSSSA